MGVVAVLKTDVCDGPHRIGVACRAVVVGVVVGKGYGFDSGGGENGGAACAAAEPEGGVGVFFTGR